MKKLEVEQGVEALIFDLDGTLLDSMSLHWQAWQVAFEKQNVHIDYDIFIQHTGKPIEEIAQELIQIYNPSIDANAVVTEKRRYVNANLASIKEIKAVADLARDYYGRLPMAIGTGSDRQRVETMLRNAQMTHMFPVIVSADDVIRHKPYPDTFLECARLMDVQPQKCQVFEDGTPGLQAAQACGMIATDVKPYYTNEISF